MDSRLIKLLPCAHRCLHRDLRTRAKEKTIKRYSKVYDDFSRFMMEFGDFNEQPVASEVDRLFMKYRDIEQISKTTHQRLLSAIEFFIPELKGTLRIAKESLKGRQLAEPVAHTVPTTSRIVFLFAAAAGADSKPRIGAAMIVQAQTGLRCDELTLMSRKDVDIPGTSLEPILIALGSTKVTKVKRKQFVRVTFDEQFEAYMLLRHLTFGVEDPDALVFGFSYWQFHAAICKYDSKFGLNLGLSAHSGRACFATEAVIIHNKPTPQVMREGRWLSETSFRTYLDGIGANAAQAKFASRGLREAGDFCRAYIFKYLPPEAFQHGVAKEEEERLSGPTSATHRRSRRPPAGATAASSTEQHRGKGVDEGSSGTAQLGARARASDGKGRGSTGQAACIGGIASSSSATSSKGKGRRKGGRAILKKQL